MRLIDADALKKSICEYAIEPIKMNDRRWNTKCRAIILDVIGTIESAPTIEPTRGRWIRYTANLLECPLCGHYTHDSDARYCSRCGAAMTEGSETDG